MSDYDLAVIYQVETKVFNQAVKRNIDRFPPDFRFQLSGEEYRNLRSQIVTSSTEHAGLTILPFSRSHDRFLILDGKVVYHLGASLKDLGKKWFAFSRMDKTSVAIIKTLQADNII